MAMTQGLSGNPMPLSSHPWTAMLPMVMAGSIGTIIEWYDFLIFGTAAVLVFNSAFFPNFNPVTGTLAALATYAVGFFARPIGGMVFGHYGDRVGRKAALMTTLVVTGAGTFAIGLLPTYNDIGLAAPILLVLLRILQGVGLGGEWGGASLMVLEHAPAGRRGLFGSLVQVGFPLGLIAASTAFALTALMPAPQFLAWGWRLPFLASIVLLALGWYLRARLPETPLFEGLKRDGRIAESPLKDTMRQDLRPFLVAVGLKISEVSWVYILTVFVVSFGVTTLGISKSLLLTAIVIAASVEVVCLPLFGWLSDRIGRRPFYFFGAGFTMVWAAPLFWFLETRDPVLICFAITVALTFGHGTMFGLESTYFPELFGTSNRYTGASLGFQVSAALGGGLAPVLAATLAGATGGTLGVALLMMILAQLTLVATLFATETNMIGLDR